MSYEDDTGGVSPWSDESSFLVGTEETDALSALVPPGIAMGDYLMISFVHWPTDPSSEAVLGDEIGVFNAMNTHVKFTKQHRRNTISRTTK